jgi:hypothetical protein
MATRRYKNIMNDEIAGYQSQLRKMRNNDGNAIVKMKKRKTL